MQEPLITDSLIAEHGISAEEYEYIKSILGRTPRWVELGIFSVMWSEHASYKNSIKLLKTLPRDGEYILAKAGDENAGVVDIGDGIAICFKIESHNHPSALEPYHGAATGVGGILRDIFTMGARPVAALNSLRFGDPSDPRVRHLIEGVVHGIADYGNCFGVPTVGGEVYCEPCYEGNPLVNAMAVGVMKHGQLAKSAAKGIGNLVVYVGAKTGRDGIHGATFASVELSHESAEMRTAVQVGDPFYEKLLLEATLEVIHSGLVIAIQDMGAAGLTCSSSEMAGKGEVGIELDVSLVPQRETGMTPYEIMLSESQERMLLIVEPMNFQAIQDIFHKWDLDAVVIGKVTEDKLLRIKYYETTVAEIPAEYLILGGKAPVYTRDMKKPDNQDAINAFDTHSVSEPTDITEVLTKLLASPNITSKEKIYRQYDHMVQIGTSVEPGSDAAVIAIKDSKKAIAMATDCNSRHCFLDPYEGTKAAVVEAALNVACSGAQPIAVTNCLNFGNPYKPEVYWSFSECIRGMGDACRALGTPVTGGNVSFYNENPSGAIYPTPVIGMLGLMQDVRKARTQFFERTGDAILLLGGHSNDIGGSEYLKTIHNTIAGKIAPIDLEQAKRLIDLIVELIEKDMIFSAHDVSDGGLLTAIAEACLKPKTLRGAVLDLDISGRADFFWFGEKTGRVIVSCAEDAISSIAELATNLGLEIHYLGKVIETPELIINKDIRIPVSNLYAAYTTGI
ncbi:MAG: phosphoribosylformylglycinamidine synthase subunit PurL [Candidatus Cloacimonadaceae bacterium]|nr:phosphoribosylformylglycinamidine synthase subunit PurL [Candidatus Cloacimonadaceae bacterium]